MGYSSHVFPMIFVFFFFITSFYCTQILIARNSLSEEEYYNYYPDIVPGLKQVHYVGNYRAGLVREQDQEPLILKKFRILLGPKKNLRAYKSRNGVPAYLSPSPSPSPSANGATAPTPRLGVHIHQPLMHHHSSLSPYKQKQKNFDRGRVEEHTRVLTAVLASVGVICCVLCAVGLFFGCRKFNKQKRTKRNVPIYTTKSRTKGISKFINSQSSAKKVSSDPDHDIFYLYSLETALEQDVCRVEPIIDSGRTCLSRNSNYVEITTVHQISESVNANPEGCNFPCIERVITEEVRVFDDKIITEGVNIFDDKIIPKEAHSSDDESFHSFCHSCSSQARNSNVSACSLSEFSEVIPQDEQTEESHFSKAVEILHSIPILSVPISQLKSPSNIPPPPPLPPSAPMHISSHHQPPSSKRMKPHLKPTTLENFSFSKDPTTIPAPPLPPSLPKENIINSFKFPPPPPSQLIQQMPLGKDGSPLPKLKPLHWDKVRATPDRSTVWDKLRSSSFEFDEEMIESLFGYNLQNPIKNDEEKSKTQSPSKHVLDPKRLQNITILSKALNVNAEQVCGALVHGYGLSLQDLEALSKMVPTKEEEDKLSNYKGDDLELGSAEKLVKAMLKIPFAFARIEAMLYRETFEDEVLHLIKSFSMLEEACKELRSSRLFLKLLEAVLKTGNRMNIGTIRGGAKAFKLDALLKLADVKGTDGKTTLLHFVVQEIVRSEGLRVSESIMGKINMRSKNTNVEDNEENYRKMGLDLVSGLSSELCNVKKTATIDLDVLANSVTNLSDSMNKLQYLVQKDMKMEETKGNFVKSMISFLTCAELKLKELQLHENRVLSHVKEITEYFHGDVSKDETNPLRIFVIVRDFLSMLDHVCKELKNSKTLRSPNPRVPFR